MRLKPSVHNWKIPGLVERMREVYLWPSKPTYEDVSAILEKEFNVSLSRSTIAGKAHRMGLWRTTPEDRAGRRRMKRPPVVELTIVPPPDPEPPVAPTPQLVQGEVEIIDLEHHHCHWPYDHPGTDRPVTYCGLPRCAGSYCQEHARKAFGGR